VQQQIFVKYHIVKCNFVSPKNVFLITLYVNFVYARGKITKLQCSLVSENFI
jgi:hypothetical protein